jgi:hypothetical protein
MALAQPAGHDRLELRVPLFETVVAGMADDRRHVLIDCGPARSGMIDILTGYRCRLDVLDLPAQLDQLRSLPAETDLGGWFERLLPATASEPADAIFCWNLLNYLAPAQIAAFLAVLTKRLKPGGQVHALIEYSSPRMPAAPGRMAPVAPTALLLEPVDAEQVDSPRYARGTLEKLMPGLKAERTMLLSNGMQEYLFRPSS